MVDFHRFGTEKLFLILAFPSSSASSSACNCAFRMVKGKYKGVFKWLCMHVSNVVRIWWWVHSTALTTHRSHSKVIEDYYYYSVKQISIIVIYCCSLEDREKAKKMTQRNNYNRHFWLKRRVTPVSRNFNNTFITNMLLSSGLFTLKTCSLYLNVFSCQCKTKGYVKKFNSWFARSKKHHSKRRHLVNCRPSWFRWRKVEAEMCVDVYVCACRCVLIRVYDPDAISIFRVFSGD